MMRCGTRLAVLSCTLVIVMASGPAAGQIPLSPVRDAGQTVTPAFEGWYPNPDGTFTLSFGYYNRNREETLDIPIGTNNFLEPGGVDQGQPTRFHPQRHWGVFTVRVPADFGDRRLIWTLVNRGQTFAIPGYLHRDWLLDANRNPATGNTPPDVRFEAGGEAGTAPDGITVGPLAAVVGRPLTLTVWVTDDEVPSSSLFGQESDPIVLMWFKHRGPGEVQFTDAEPGVDVADGGRSMTTASFSAPGDYVLRVRANDYSGNVAGGHAQCCWTNGYVKVTVAE